MTVPRRDGSKDFARGSPRHSTVGRARPCRAGIDHRAWWIEAGAPSKAIACQRLGRAGRIRDWPGLRRLGGDALALPRKRIQRNVTRERRTAGERGHVRRSLTDGVSPNPRAQKEEWLAGGHRVGATESAGAAGPHENTSAEEHGHQAEDHGGRATDHAVAAAGAALGQG